MTTLIDKPKILCVDDELSVLEALERVLRNDFHVLKSQSGDEALRILETIADCAIILSDFRMPGINGIDFLKKSRALSPQSVRAILSGQIDISQLAEAINAAEIHRFILKPWDNDILRLQMLEALQWYNSLQEKARYRNLSVTDPVTGLTNHRFFQEKLQSDFQSAQKSQQPLSLIMVDVDHFKSFNDHYGHPEGDRLLVNVAQRIMEYFPQKGIASRYGGEEFGIILPQTDWKKAFELGEALRQSLESHPFQGPLGRSAYVTISVGVATFPDHAKDPAQLVSLADKALYQAKRQGRNQTVLAS